MNRREFLRSIGMAGAVLALDPSALIASPSTKPVIPEFFAGYPPVRFDGFKQPINVDAYVGSFRWAVLWDDGEREDLTFWYQNCSVSGIDLRHTNARLTIDSNLQLSLLRVVDMMDGIAADAINGKVQNAEYEQEPNPDYDPTKPAFYEDEDGFDIWNGKTISTNVPILKSVKRVKIVSWDDVELCHWVDKKLQVGELWAKEYPAEPSFDIEAIRNKALELFPRLQR